MSYFKKKKKIVFLTNMDLYKFEGKLLKKNQCVWNITRW